MLPIILLLPAVGTADGVVGQVLEGSEVALGTDVGTLVVPLTTTISGGFVQETVGTTSERVTMSFVDDEGGQELQVTVEALAVASTPYKTGNEEVSTGATRYEANEENPSIDVDDNLLERLKRRVANFILSRVDLVWQRIWARMIGVETERQRQIN
jgi:hypothetical protein